MRQKTKAAKADVTVPKDLIGAAEFIRRVGQEQRIIANIQADLNVKIEALQAKAIADARSHEEVISALVEGLFCFAETHRDELTEHEKKKTIVLPTGSFFWRMTPPAVSVRNIKQVLANLKALKLNDFIRLKEEIDKEALLRKPDLAKTVGGITISQYEQFVVKPAELKIEITTQIKKQKRVSRKKSSR